MLSEKVGLADRFLAQCAGIKEALTLASFYVCLLFFNPALEMCTRCILEVFAACTVKFLSF